MMLLLKKADEVMIIVVSLILWGEKDLEHN